MKDETNSELGWRKYSEYLKTKKEENKMDLVNFNELMESYEKENESIIYEIGLTLFRVTHFAMTAFLVVHVIS